MQQSLRMEGGIGMPKRKVGEFLGIVAGGVLLTTSLWAAPALGAEPNADVIQPLAGVCNTYGSCARDISNWQGVRLSDTECDGNTVHTDYYRQDGQYRRLDWEKGCGTSGETGLSSSNLVNKFRACTNINFRPDPCSDYIFR
jgi:hypothetical protein